MPFVGLFVVVSNQRSDRVCGIGGTIDVKKQMAAIKYSILFRGTVC